MHSLDQEAKYMHKKIFCLIQRFEKKNKSFRLNFNNQFKAKSLF